MTAAPALIALVAPAVDEPLLLSITTRTTETIRPARLLQGSLTFLLGSVELNGLVQRQTLLELNAIHGHDDLDWYSCTSTDAKGLLTELAT
jgi:hypothetical protein